MVAPRTVVIGLVVTAALVLGVGSATAGPNLVPNPGFETACGSVPCNWTALPQTSIARDTVNPHAGSASLAATSTGGLSDFGARSDCFSISPATAYTVEGWYRTTATALADVRLVLDEYSDASCGPFSALGIVSASPPVTTGAWTFVQGQVTTNASALSARLAIGATCPGNCPAGATVNFDDVRVFTGTLAVTLVSLSAHRTGKGMLLHWRTGTEANELGFNVYRQQGARRVRVNRRLLPALGGLGGSSYSYRDRRAPRHRALRYWLQDVAVDGTRAWHGPVRVSGA